MLYRMKSGCDKSSYTGTKNYCNVLQFLCIQRAQIHQRHWLHRSRYVTKNMHSLLIYSCTVYLMETVASCDVYLVLNHHRRSVLIVVYLMH